LNHLNGMNNVLRCGSKNWTTSLEFNIHYEVIVNSIGEMVVGEGANKIFMSCRDYEENSSNRD
jgi:hypothetical protein